MSETVNSQPKVKPTTNSSRDARAFAQVEKWLAVIREISREQANS